MPPAVDVKFGWSHTWSDTWEFSQIWSSIGDVGRTTFGPVNYSNPAYMCGT